MTITPRSLFNDKSATDYDGATVLCKYMPYTPNFESLIKHASLYLRRLDKFQDEFEGVTSLAEWDAIEGSEVRKVYESNRRFTFVTCFTIGPCEKPHMWANYAGKPDESGLMVMTTVRKLKDELSNPPGTCDPEMTKTSAGELPKGDGFTVGGVEYFSDSDVNLHGEMLQGVSNLRPVFRKRRAFEDEEEFRVVLRSGSRTSELASRTDDESCLVPIRLSNLIMEIRLKPGSSSVFRDQVESLLRQHGLSHIPVCGG